mmetsp:Transcript_4379/g.11163  ORF Transcript_4379/g.11163 Transcript_4379/m.11163 type:complete len:274 (+) Transcript_4379:393-1214(+)
MRSSLRRPFCSASILPSWKNREMLLISFATGLAHFWRRGVEIPSKLNSEALTEVVEDGNAKSSLSCSGSCSLRGVEPRGVWWTRGVRAMGMPNKSLSSSSPRERPTKDCVMWCELGWLVPNVRGVMVASRSMLVRSGSWLKRSVEKRSRSEDTLRGVPWALSSPESENPFTGEVRLLKLRSLLLMLSDGGLRRPFLIESIGDVSERTGPLRPVASCRTGERGPPCFMSLSKCIGSKAPRLFWKALSRMSSYRSPPSTMVPSGPKACVSSCLMG